MGEPDSRNPISTFKGRVPWKLSNVAKHHWIELDFVRIRDIPLETLDEKNFPEYY